MTFPKGRLEKSTWDSLDLVVGVTVTGYFTAIIEREFDSGENLNYRCKVKYLCQKKKYYSKFK